MTNHRIIARLDIKGPNLVKGIHLEGLRVLGKPEEFARYYYENGADELIYMDVVASLYNRNSLLDIISRTAKDIFIPLTVGGGLRTVEDMQEVLNAGADKVVINTAAVKRPGIIQEASRKFGSSTIVVAIEAILQNDGMYVCYTDNGRNHTGLEVLAWARQAEALGAGEIMVTAVDKEGTGQGFDIALIEMVANGVSVPVIAHGGAGKKEHIFEAVSMGKADAVAIASLFHYEFIKTNRYLSDYEKSGNTEFLKSGRTFSKIDSLNPQETKRYLIAKGIHCRHDKRAGSPNGATR